MDRTEAAERAVTMDSVVKSLSVAPLKTSLARRYNAPSVRKALGEAGVGAEVRKVCPEVTADVFTPLHLKACIPARSPI